MPVDRDIFGSDDEELAPQKKKVIEQEESQTPQKPKERKPIEPREPKERKESSEPREPKRNVEIDALKAEMAELRKESAESNKLKTEIAILRKEMQDRLSICEDTDGQILAIQNGVEQWDLIKRSEESKWKSEKKGSPYMMGIVKQMDNYFEMQKEKLKKLKKACVSK